MKKVMIIGAGLLQTYIIKRAKELGYITVCVDGNPDAIGFKYADYCKPINIIDKEECLQYAQEMKIDGIITAATDYGVLTVSYIAKRLGLIGNSDQVCEAIKNKYMTRKILAENKVDSITEFYEITELTQVDNIAKTIEFPVIVKPCDGSGSRGINKIDSKEGLKVACEKAMEASLSKKVLIEKFIVGQEYGVESFVHKGEVNVLAILQKTMTEPPIYAELGHCSLSGLDHKVEEEIRNKVTKAIKALGITTGSVNMDLLITKNNEIYIVDIGARMGGNLIGSHIVPLSTGIDYMGSIIKESLGERIALNRSIFNKVVASRLLTLTPGRVKEVRNMEDVKTIEDVCEVVINVKENHTIHEYKSNLDGCGYVVVRNSNAEVAKNKVLELKNEIDKRVIRY